MKKAGVEKLSMQSQKFGQMIVPQNFSLISLWSVREVNTIEIIQGITRTNDQAKSFHIDSNETY